MKKLVLKISLVALAFAIVSSYTACKKDNTSTTTTTPPSYKVKSTIEVSTTGGSTSTDSDTYTYDTQGRVLADNSSFISTIFVINGSNISITVSAYPEAITGTLNAAGTIAYLTEPAVGNSGPMIIYNYGYDATGALVSDSSYWSTGTNTGPEVGTTCVWTDSNLVSARSTNYSGSSPVTTTYAYTYLTTREYRDYDFGAGTQFSDFGLGTVASRNTKNLVNTETDVVGGVSTTYTHSYTFDNSSRVTRESVSGTDGSSSVTSYTY